MANKNFKARIGIEAPLIAADDGTTAITLSNNDVTVVGDLTVTSNTIKSSSATAITLSGSDVVIAGNLEIDGNIIKASDGTTAITLSASTGNITLAGDLAVNGGDITTTQTTASVFNTTATTVNAFGAATTTNIGSKTGSSIINGTNRFTSPTINAFTGSVSPSRGYMQSNGNAGSLATVRNSIVMRTFPTVAGTARGSLIYENSRGTETTPTALQSGDLMGEVSATGYATNGWVSDFIASGPGVTYFTPTENWANTGGPYPTAGTVTNAGMGYIIALQPSATTVTASNGSRINVLNINPQTTTFRTDAYNFNSKANSSLATLDSSGNMVLTGDLTVTGNDIKSSSATALTLSGADVAVAGDLTVTGNDIKSSGTNTVLQFDDVNARVAGELTITGNKIRSSGGSAFPNGDIAIELSGTNVTVPGSIQGATILTVGPFDTSQTITANATLLDTNTAAGGVFGIVTRYKASSGATNLTVPQSGYRMGGFKVNGFADTAGTDGTLAGQVSVKVTENWTTTANGTAIEFLANKQGEDWTTGHKVVISASPESSLIASDIITLENSAGTDYLTLNSTEAYFFKPIRQKLQTANVARGGTYTLPANDLNVNSLTITAGTAAVTYIDVDNVASDATSGGMYSILIYNNSGANNIDVQVRNNGTNIGLANNLDNGDRAMASVYVVDGYAACEIMDAA